MRELEDLRANWGPYFGHVYGHIETIVDSGIRSLGRNSDVDPVSQNATEAIGWIRRKIERPFIQACLKNCKDDYEEKKKELDYVLMQNPRYQELLDTEIRLQREMMAQLDLYEINPVTRSDVAEKLMDISKELFNTLRELIGSHLFDKSSITAKS